MAEPLTLAVLLDQLSRHRLRVTKVDFFASGYVANFTVVPDEKVVHSDRKACRKFEAFGSDGECDVCDLPRSAHADVPPEADEPYDPDALDAFMKLKGRT